MGFVNYLSRSYIFRTENPKPNRESNEYPNLYNIVYILININYNLKIFLSGYLKLYELFKNMKSLIFNPKHHFLIFYPELTRLVYIVSLNL